ncbi:MAG: hypothetical protein HPZ91_00640 [Lentisphaeria bacterium]|nr:hypothetical protein [Lentisphaeria bacterium]
MSSAILYLTTGQPGCGKTYSRVRWLMTDFLLNSTGLYITNLPLNVDVIADYMSQKTGKPREYFLFRLHVIPDEEMKSWRSLNDKSRKQELADMKASGNFPPVQYLESLDLSGARVAIDEFHRYFNKKSPADVLVMWNDWFAEIRKTGCTFEAITQDLDQLPPEFVGKVGLRTDLVPYNTVRDPFFRIPLGDWYELRAAYAGLREQKVCQTEYRKGTSFTGRAKWVANSVDRFSITADYFPFYNSYQKTEATGTTASVVYPADRYKKMTALWFLRKHFFKLLGRILLVIIFFWATFGGGITKIIMKFTDTLATINQKNMAVADGSKKSLQMVPASSSAASVVKRAGEQAGELPGSSAAPISSPESDLRPYKPVMFMGDGCYLRSGIFVTRDYMFKGGPYEGKKVVSVDFENRCYELDNGELVGMY